MSGINRVTLLGNIGADAEIRYTQDGKCVASFSVATSESWKDKNTDQWQERTDWHNCVCFDKIGERAAKQIKKGKPIYVEGKIVYKKDEKNGVKLTYTTIKVTDFRVMEHPAKNTENDHDKAPAQADDLNDDIPF